MKPFRLIVLITSLLLFWSLIFFFFNINRMDTDGANTFGIPYKVISQYYDREYSEFPYKHKFHVYNLLKDILFIAIVTFFNYFFFRYWWKK